MSRITKFIEEWWGIIFIVGSAICLVVVLIKAGHMNRKSRLENEAKIQAEMIAKRNSACPTFLSITRSSRDTLLVMRAEPLCVKYVLDNVK